MDKVAIVNAEDLEKEALAAVAAATSARRARRGRGSTTSVAGAPLKLALREVRDRETGMALNAVREALEQAFAARQERARARRARRRGSRPSGSTSRCRRELLGRAGSCRPRGTLHPSTLVRRDVEDIFLGLGYEIVDGREVETIRYNFDALGSPTGIRRARRATRSSSTTRLVLRTETSPSQIHKMEEQRAADLHGLDRPRLPARHDRRDALPDLPPVRRARDRPAGSRSPTSRGRCCTSCARSSGAEREVRFRTHYFPFTEPSMEPDVSCFDCGGAGCPICKHSGWIEIGGSGMVDPYLLRVRRLGPGGVDGLRVRVGIERTAQLRYGIPSIRPFWENDLRFLRQFR